jgi:hypothetical protein
MKIGSVAQVLVRSRGLHLQEGGRVSPWLASASDVAVGSASDLHNDSRERPNADGGKAQV